MRIFTRFFKVKPMVIKGTPYFYRKVELPHPGTQNLAFESELALPLQSSSGNHVRKQLMSTFRPAVTLGPVTTWAGIPNISHDMVFQPVVNDPTQQGGNS